MLHKKTELGAFVDRFNISLHSLDHEKYGKIVGKRNTLNDVIT